MSQRGRPRNREGAVRRGLSEPVWRSLIQDWDTEDENDEVDKEELHGDDVDWVDDDVTSNNDEMDESDQQQRNIRVLGTRDPPRPRDDDEDGVEADQSDQETPRRVRRDQRAIKTLADALNPDNYDMMQLPNVSERKEVTGILERKARNQPQIEINFKNWKRTNRGRNPRYLNLFEF